MAEHIVAVFETDAAAAAAAETLRSAGIPSSAIRQYAGSGSGRQEIEPTEHTSTHTSGGGFWSWLFGQDSTVETTHSAYTGDAYNRRASAGNVVLSVRVDDDAKIHQAIAALEAHNPIDVDERSDEVDEGITASSVAPLTGPSTVGQEFSSGAVAQAGMPSTTQSGRAGIGGAPVSPTSSDAPSAIPDTRSGREVPEGEQVVPLSEEQLKVGKQTVDRGTTRIRRYVVEKPVEETVSLRDERVTVERRQPIETTAAPGGRAFEERVVEVRETAEEPVVAKTARVVEEVVVGREATERTETVKDTVRHEEVEVTKGSGMKE
jgi:uncharacterized protein (TIGR02271 family)